MDHFIRWYDDTLPKDICRDIVRRFEAAPDRFAGMVAGAKGRRVVETLKQTTELYISMTEEWSDVRQALQQSVNKWLGVYAKEVQFLKGAGHKSVDFERLRVKKYEIGQQFHWHIDCTDPRTLERCLAVQWYFNDVAEGGATEFEAQRVSIPCVEGRLAFFPVSWTYRHRGAPPASGPKYVCTTFVKPRWQRPADASKADAG